MLYQYHLFKYKYPKLTILVMCILVAYMLFRQGFFMDLIMHITNYGLFSVFIAGILFSFGFTAPFAVAFFVALNPTNPLLIALVGGLGALCGDMFIFSLVKTSFMKEFTHLEHEKLIKKAEKFFGKEFHGKLGHHLLIVFAGLIIASPLPNEIGITLLAGLSKINHYLLALLSFILGAIGILILLLI